MTVTAFRSAHGPTSRDVVAAVLAAGYWPVYAVSVAGVRWGPAAPAAFDARPGTTRFCPANELVRYALLGFVHPEDLR